MEQIFSLLTLVIALLTAVQQNPDLPPQIRAQALSIAQQSIVMVSASQETTPPAQEQQPAQTPAPETPAAQEQNPAPATPETPAEEPVQYTGTIDVSLGEVSQSVQKGASLARVVELRITNNRNEIINISRDVARYVRANNTVENWQPVITGSYNNGSLSSPHSLLRIPAGATVSLFIYVSNVPNVDGSFTITIDPYGFEGLASGDLFTATGGALTTGAIAIQ